MQFESAKTFLSNSHGKAAAALVFFKILLLLLFSSAYQDSLFLPFIDHFLSNPGNPWQYFHTIQIDMFPYPPLMLYIMALFYLPAHLLATKSIIVQNLFFKLPTLGADIAILVLLMKMFPTKLREVVIYYFASPIIIYASYMHSQLDLLPMAVLLFSVHSLTSGRLLHSAIALGLAASIKFHVVAALPLMMVYIWKNHRRSRLFSFISIPALVYLFFAFPYLMSDGYINMVLKNPKQMMLYDVFYAIGELKIYLPLVAVLAVYSRFIAYSRINNDLFFSFLGILFSTFVLLIFPSPAWYIWMTPFLSMFFIDYSAKSPKILFLFIALNGLYLIYFIFFHIPDHPDLSFLGSAISFKFHDERLRNIVYSALEVALFATIYTLHMFGVRSNAVYKKAHNFVIGIGGDSAAGKSMVLADIKLLLGETVMELEGDADHKWARNDDHWRTYTHLHPKANDLHKQAQDLLALKSGKSISRNDYNHDTGEFTESRKIDPCDFIILSGLHPFYLPISRKVIDLKIYLDTQEKLRQHWKILRDMSVRGYTQERVIESIAKRVEDAKKYVHPQRDYADVTLSYFADDDFECGNFAAKPDLKLKIVMGSSVHVENLVKYLDEYNIKHAWDYSDDLKSQFLILTTEPGVDLIRQIAYDIIPNISELISKRSQWLPGYRGVVQLLFLLVLSEKIREASREREL